MLGYDPKYTANTLMDKSPYLIYKHKNETVKHIELPKNFDGVDAFSSGTATFVHKISIAPTKDGDFMLVNESKINNTCWKKIGVLRLSKDGLSKVVDCEPAMITEFWNEKDKSKQQKKGKQVGLQK
jgi:hypothetical protein